MPSRIAIIGACDPGSWLAVHLARAGHSVHLCTRRDPGLLQIDGLPPLLLPHYLDAGPPADIAFLTTKTYDNPIALRRVTLSVSPPFKTASANRASPSLLTSTSNRSRASARASPPGPHFTIPAGTPLPGLFRHTPIQFYEATDFRSAAWRKNAPQLHLEPPYRPRRRSLEILREDLYRSWAEKLLAEALPIAAPPPGPASMAQKSSPNSPPIPRAPAPRCFRTVSPANSLELAALNGHLIELGRQFDLPTRQHENLLTMLSR
jgi:hypothetical protein